jgi:hypothetical protein
MTYTIRDKYSIPSPVVGAPVLAYLSGVNQSLGFQDNGESVWLL